MRVLVDSTAWSAAFRHRRPDERLTATVDALVREARVALLGLVRQEVLSGIHHRPTYLRLRSQLRIYRDHRVRRVHHEEAARMYTLLQANGIQAGVTDALLCAVSVMDQLPIYTADDDFSQYHRHLPIALFTADDR